MLAKEYTEQEARARAKKGAEFMDQVKPGWAYEIKEKLEMENCHRCILGQLFGEFSDGCEEVGFEWEDDRIMDLGFDLYLDDMPDLVVMLEAGLYDLLTNAWMGEIKERTSD